MGEDRGGYDGDLSGNACVTRLLSESRFRDGKIKIKGRSVDVANDPVAKEFYLGKDFTL